MPDVVCLGQFTADVVVTPVNSLPEKGKTIFVDNISLHNGKQGKNELWNSHKTLRQKQ